MPAPPKGTEPRVGYSRAGTWIQYEGSRDELWRGLAGYKGLWRGKAEPPLTSTGGVPERSRGL